MVPNPNLNPNPNLSSALVLTVIQANANSYNLINQCVHNSSRIKFNSLFIIVEIIGLPLLVF